MSKIETRSKTAKQRPNPPKQTKTSGSPAKNSGSRPQRGVEKRSAGS